MSRRAVALTEIAALALLCGLAVWLRWPALWTEGFHNEDAAGIAYNADLLRAGGLPLIDNLELKAPGSFYLAWFSWALFGRSIATLQQVACFWAVLGALGVYCGGRWLFDRRAGAIAALIFVVFSPITDSIDINYQAWMSTPYIWAAALFVRGMKTGRGRWWLACGVVLAVAGLMKRQGAFATPVFLALLVLGPRLPRPDDWAPAPRVLPALGWFFGGLALGFAPILGWYAAHGELGRFIANYFFSEGGWKYAGSPLPLGEKPGRVADGLQGFFEYLATATLAAILTVAAALRSPREKWGVRAVFLTGHFWLSFLGAAVGLRFFKGYYLQVLPAAAWIAAHPKGALWRWFEASTWRGGRAATLRAAAMLALLAVALSPALIHDLRELGKIRRQRAVARDVAARNVGEVIKANSDPSDRIWVWGRWGWPVYFHADRLAATRFPKTLAVFTTNLTNTWRRPTKPTRFDPNSDWRALIADLERDRPAFIVLSRNEDYSQFTALKSLVRKDYRVVPGLNESGFSVYHRKDHPLPAPPARRPPRPMKPKVPKRPTGPPSRGLPPGLKPAPTAPGESSDAGPRPDAAPRPGLNPNRMEPTGRPAPAAPTRVAPTPAAPTPAAPAPAPAAPAPAPAAPTPAAPPP